MSQFPKMGITFREYTSTAHICSTMCGILFSVQKQEDVTPEFESLWLQLKESNAARGMTEIS